jgi:hypothetical protein
VTGKREINVIGAEEKKKISAVREVIGKAIAVGKK